MPIIDPVQEIQDSLDRLRSIQSRLLPRILFEADMEAIKVFLDVEKLRHNIHRTLIGK